MASENIKIAAAHLRRAVDDKKQEINQHRQEIADMDRNYSQEITRLKQEIGEMETALRVTNDAGEHANLRTRIHGAQREIGRVQDAANRQHREIDQQINGIEGMING